MNTQPKIQNFSSNRSPLYTVTNQQSSSDTSNQYQKYLSGEMPPTDLGVKLHPASDRYIHFVEHIRALIEANIDDETYGIDQLCRDAGASRSQIHNKLKKWTGLSTSYFIRSIKLQKAKFLLVQTDLNITQVAYEVGFNDSSYFSRVFDESFGISPKNFRKRWQKTFSAA